MSPLELARNCLEALLHSGQLLVVEDLRRAQGARVRPRLLHVVRRQAPVEADRGVQAPEQGIGRIAKTGHARQCMKRIGCRAGEAPRHRRDRQDRQCGRQTAGRPRRRGRGAGPERREGPRAAPAGIDLAQGDVTDPDSLRRAVDGAEGVFNCMGLFEQWFADPGVFERVNAEGARTVSRPRAVPASDARSTRPPSTSSMPKRVAPCQRTLSPTTRRAPRMSARSSEPRSWCWTEADERDRTRGRQPLERSTALARGRERGSTGRSRRDPPPPARCSTRWDDARLRRRRRRRPPGRLRAREPRASATSSPTATRRCARSSRSPSQKPAVAGFRPPSPRARRGGWRKPAKPSRG